MKILFDHPLPFALAHGGFQIQIEQTMAALAGQGVEVETVRWWDEGQSGDIIHYFGRPNGSYIGFAHDKGRKVVVAELHTGLGSRGPLARFVQRGVKTLAQHLAPGSFIGRMAWESYRVADAFIALTAWEAEIMEKMFDADAAKIHIIPNGVESVFMRPHIGGGPIVCTAAIAPRKRVVELAEAAAEGKVPVWIIGKPYSESDPYYRRLLDVQKHAPEWVRYEGAISDRQSLAQIYSEASAFVLLSTQESLSLSALEAAACGCPLLLSDLPWARSVFHDKATYLSISADTVRAGRALRDIYDKSTSAKSDFQPLTWDQVATQIIAVYEKILR